jgi:DNA-binding MarR family transcriptional regulator
VPSPADEERDRVDDILMYVARVHPELDTTTKAVAWRLRRAAHHIDTEVRRRLVPQGIDLWELEILSALNRAGGTLTMGELLDVAQLTSGAITNRVGRLEREGRVRRETAPGDRRQILVTLTAAGRERNEEVVTANDAAEREVFATIDRGLQERLARELHTLLLATEGPSPSPRQAD